MDRFFGSKSKSRRNDRPVFDLGYEEKRNVHNLSQWWAVAIVFAVLLLASFSKYQMLSLPRALTANDEAHHPDAFIAERARVDLRILNDFGPRPTGSHANEVLAVDFLKREIAHIQTNAHPSQKVYASVQRVSGSYWAGFKPHGMTNMYRDVQNVVAKLVGQRERSGAGNETLMLNCHFDSVAGSPGASDDAASCCVMLEVLRVLSKQAHVLRHSVLMLFNGAEETPLQASHGFITQHEWATAVRAFLNLESVGSNGKELLFQAGPEHSWLIDMYREVVPHPNGHVAGEEIFQSGLIPSDTDFRIFRDYGHVPGMDFAHVLNGYRYHTRFDHIDYLPAAVLQRTGDNILALVRRIGDSDQLQHSDRYAGGRSVYFDVLGVFFVAYDESVSYIVNATCVILALALPYLYLRRATRGTNVSRIRAEMLLGAASTVLGAVAAAGVALAIASEVDAAGHALVWYHHTVFAVALYCVPVVAVLCVVHRLSTLLKRSGGAPLSAGLQVQARLNGVNLVMAVGVMVCTFLGLRSAYVFAVPLAVSAVTSAVIAVTGMGNSIKKWLYVHLAGQVFFVLWSTSFYHLIAGMFIPIAGRSGNAENPEVPVAMIGWLLTVYITCYLMPLVSLLRRTRWFLVTLVVVFVLTRWGCISMTHTGFPYRGTVENPTPQRHMITHTLRTVYDAQGQVSYSDSGFFFRELDRNTHKTLESLVAPDLLMPQQQNALCQQRPFCGLPYYTCRQLHTDGFWLPGPAPILKHEAHLTNITRTRPSPTEHTLSFTITGQVLLSLQLAPKPGFELVNWDLTEQMPSPNVYQQREAYFVMMTHGLAAEPRNVTLTFRSDHTSSVDRPPLVDVSLVTYHWEYHKEHTTTFAGLLAKMPDWTFTVPSVASVQSWTF